MQTVVETASYLTKAERLLTVFGKQERANLSRAEINQLAKLCRQIQASYEVDP